MAVRSVSAREFFVSRIANEAQQEGIPLTTSQRTFLESGGEYSRQEEAEFDKENPEYLKFMERVTELLRRSLAHESSRDSEGEKKYRAALGELDKAEGGSPLWFAAVPAVHPAELQQGLKSAWVIVVAVLLLGFVIGLYVMNHGPR